MSVVEVRGKFPLHRDQPERSCRTSRMEANAGIQPGTESSAKGTEGNESMKEMSEGRHERRLSLTSAAMKQMT